MKITLLKSKLHRAEVTDSSLDYEGSLGIDWAFMEEVGMLPYEKILVGNITRGTRFETYAIPAKEGSKAIVLNGAAAHLGKIGDLLVIMSFATFEFEEANRWKPKVRVLSDNNQTLTKGSSFEL